MKLNKIASAVALAVGMCATAQAGVSFDPDGGGALGPIDMAGIDWQFSSVLGLGATTAIVNYQTNQTNAFLNSQDGGSRPTNLSTQFDVLTHAIMNSTTNSSGASNTPAGLNSSFEITMVARFTQTVTGLGIVNTNTIATFATVPTAGGFLQFYYDNNSATFANALNGFGYNNGRLILAAGGIGFAEGTFSRATSQTAVILDGFQGDSYAGQQSYTGTGSNGLVDITNITVDPAFFLSRPTSITLNYSNISEQIPFASVDPSDCFTGSAFGGGVGTSTGAGIACSSLDHDSTKQMDAQTADPNGGVAPKIGSINGATPTAGGPDVIFQSDYNATMNGIPEPGILALLGLGLAGLATAGRRRRPVA